MTYTITGVASLGTVTDEESNKDAQLFTQPMPASDSTDAIVLDIFGTIRNFSITGIYTVSDGTIATFVNLIDDLCDGGQTKVTYHSDKSGRNYGVYLLNVKWFSTQGEVNKVGYIINMIEGV